MTTRPTVVKHDEKKGLRYTTKDRLKLKRTPFGPEVNLDHDQSMKDCFHIPILLVLAAPRGGTLKVRFAKQVPIMAVLQNRHFDLASFLAQKPKLCVYGPFYLTFLALCEVLKDGTLSFKKHRKGWVMVRYSLGPHSFHARISHNDASLFFDGL